MPFLPEQAQLPNHLREHLLGQGRGHAVLALDALLSMGVRPGTELTLKDAHILLRAVYGMRLHTLRKALADPLFARRKSAPHRDSRGRPPQLYRVPAPDAAQKRLGISGRSPGDRLQREDFRSLSRYRMALHREIIARNFKPMGGELGMFKASRALLTQRLGVSVRTLRRYEAQLGTTVLPQVAYEPVYFEDAPFLPQSKPRHFQPLWLEAEKAGQPVIRVPLVGSLALKYLQSGYAVFRCQREVNRYAPANHKTALWGKYAEFFEY